MQQTERLRLELRRTYSARPEELFRAWTTPAVMARFMTPGKLDATEVTADVRVGGRFHLDMNDPNGKVYPHDGEYLVIDPPRRLSFTWVSLACPAELASVVTIEFKPAGSGTELVLTHEGVPAEPPGKGHERGWTLIMEQVASVV